MQVRDAREAPRWYARAGAVRPRACQPRVTRCTLAAASARRSSPAVAKMLSSSGSDTDEMGSPCTPEGRLPLMKRGAGMDTIVMSALRLGSTTPLLPLFVPD